MIKRLIRSGFFVDVVESWSANLSYEEGFFETGGRMQRMWLEEAHGCVCRMVRR